MAGALIKLQQVVASNSSIVEIGGTEWDSSYDVYKLIHKDVTGTVDDTHLRLRILKASDNSADTTSNYDESAKLFRTDDVFSNSSSRNLDFGRIQATGTGTATQEVTHCTYYLFNFNNSSEYNYLTNEEMMYSSSSVLQGSQGGLVHTVAQASTGLQFYMNSGNIASGTFTLYGLKK